jgi:hypothetical protein
VAAGLLQLEDGGVHPMLGRTDVVPRQGLLALLDDEAGAVRANGSIASAGSK